MGFTHIDKNNLPTMVDISSKKITVREATAVGEIYLGDAIYAKINKHNQIESPKGNVISTAIIAGTMGVKSTSQLIPFCHPISISSVKFDINLNRDEKKILISCHVKTSGSTGVEMEAITGVSVCALTIYDMCKAISHDMQISNIRLKQKVGGKRNIKNGVLCE